MTLRRWPRRHLAWFHILRCSDGALHIGSIENLAARLARHNQGRGCAFTATRTPVPIVYTEAFETRSQAVASERQLKP